MEASASSVAEKTLAWYRRALDLYPHARHVAKADDDSMPNFRTLLADLAALQSPVLYYGVMRWRLWQPSHINGACGAGGAGGGYGRPFSPTAARLVGELYTARTTGECAGAVGPYLYADGSLHVLGHALLRHTLSSATASRFIEERSSSHRWTTKTLGSATWCTPRSLRTARYEQSTWCSAAGRRTNSGSRWTTRPHFRRSTPCGRTTSERRAPPRPCVPASTSGGWRRRRSSTTRTAGGPSAGGTRRRASSA